MKEIADFEALLEEVAETFTQLLRESPYESGLGQKELRERLHKKGLLRKALRSCIYGDVQAKRYVKDCIRDMLVKKYGMDHQRIQRYMNFQDPFLLSAEEKFAVLLYLYRREKGVYGLEQLLQDYELDRAKFNGEGMPYYEITKEDIHRVYDEYPYLNLDFNDKLNILSQRLYERYKGNGVIDEIRDMRIDGVSAGVSGIPENYDMNGMAEGIAEARELPASYDSIWLFFHGKSIHLSFLGFHSERELIRVCRNIYRYNNPEQLSAAKGYTVNEMMDGSRVAVARPPFCESWVLFVRKFDMVLQEDIHKLITDENRELPIAIMRWVIRGCQVTGITGEQGSGKTTLLMSLIGFIPPSYNLRVHELSFELHLRRIYPDRNIVTFRETADVSGQEGLDFQKKSDGTVSILGEVASNPVCCWLISMAQVASLFTLFTHHAKTTENLVISMRNALLLEGGFHDEKAACRQVTGAIRFDVHMKKGSDGHRYIERINEIVPREDQFSVRELVYFKEGKYVKGEGFSAASIEDISSHLEPAERKDFQKFVGEWENEGLVSSVVETSMDEGVYCGAEAYVSACKAGR